MGSGCFHISRRRFLACAGMALAAPRLYAASKAEEDQSESKPHEAMWYDPLDDREVRCMLCPRHCVVPDGQRGHCGVRENRGGRYYTLVYGRPVTTNLDPIEKKPFYHVYPGTMAYSLATVGCNIHCKFCQNWEISQKRPEDAPVPYVSPAAVAKAAAEKGAKTIAYTYSEPTIYYEYMVDCAKAGKDVGVESVIVSNGFISEKAQKTLIPLLKAYKVDFKGFTQDFYANVCNGYLQPVMDSLKRISQSGVWLEIVVLLIPTLNDDPDDLKRMTAWIVKELGPNVPVIFTRYHPAYKIRNIPATPPKSLERARQIAMAAGCNYAYTGNVEGLDSANTYCPKCKALVVKRYGMRTITKTTGKCEKCENQIPGVWA